MSVELNLRRPNGQFYRIIDVESVEIRHSLEEQSDAVATVSRPVSSATVKKLELNESDDEIIIKDDNNEPIFGGILRDVNWQGPRVRLHMDSFERYARDAEPAAPTEEVTAPDEQIIKNAVQASDEIEPGDIDSIESEDLTFQFHHASQALKIRKVRQVTKGEIFYNADKTVDYKQQIGQDKTNETLNSEHQHFVNQLHVTRNTGESLANHLRVIGSGTSVDVVSDGFNSHEDRVKWRRAYFSDTGDPDTLRKRGKTLLSIIDEPWVKVEAELSNEPSPFYEIDPHLGDTYHVHVPEKRVDHDLRITEIIHRIDKNGERWEATLTNRDIEQSTVTESVKGELRKSATTSTSGTGTGGSDGGGTGEGTTTYVQQDRPLEGDAEIGDKWVQIDHYSLGDRWDGSQDSDNLESTTKGISQDADYVYTGAAVFYSVAKQTGELDWRYGMDGYTEWRIGEDGGILYFVPSDTEDVVALDTATFEQLWRTDYINRSEMLPFLVDDKVYVGHQDGMIAVNKTDGSLAWNTALTSSAYSQVGADSNNIYFGTQNGVVMALDKSTGAKQWEYATGASIISGLGVNGSTVYVADSNNNLRSLSGGSQNWSISLPAQFEGDGLLVDSSNIYFGLDNNTFYAHDQTDGSQVWSASHGYPSGIPNDDSNYVYSVADGGTAYKYAKSDGTISWSTTLSGASRSEPGLTTSHVYVVNQGGNAYKLNKSDGTIDWHNSNTDVNDNQGPVIISNGTVFFGPDTSSSFLKGLDTTDGSWNLRYGTRGDIGGTVADSNYVYFDDTDGFIYAVDPAGPSLVWLTQVDNSSNAGLTHDSNYLYIGTRSGTVYRINKSDGTVNWSTGNLSGYINSDILIGDSAVYAGGQSEVISLNKSDGVENWTSATAGWVGEELTQDADNVYLGTGSNTVEAYAKTNGSRVWQTGTDSTTDSYAANDGTRVFFGDANGKLYALNMSDGSIAWTYAFDNNYLKAIRHRNGVVFAMDEVNQIRTFDSSTGDQIAQASASTGGGFTFALDETDDYLYFGTDVTTDLLYSRTTGRFESVSRHWIFDGSYWSRAQ